MGKTLSATRKNVRGTLQANTCRELLKLYCRDIDGPHSLNDLLQWIDEHKARNHMVAKRTGLASLEDWRSNGNGHFTHKEDRFFRIAGVRVSSPSREVSSWSQPIVSNAGTGIIGLLVRKRRKAMDVLLQAKAEVGNRTIIQLAPTVQFTPGNYQDSTRLKKPFLYDEFLHPGRFRLVSESRQSEEGGRFYKEDHLHRILLLPRGKTIDLPSAYRWFSLGQVRFFLHLGEQVNYCARSILSCLLALGPSLWQGIVDHDKL